MAADPKWVKVPGPAHARLAEIRDDEAERLGRVPTFGEIIELLLCVYDEAT